MENYQSDNATQNQYKKIFKKTVKPDARQYGSFDEMLPPKILSQSKKQAYKYGMRKAEASDWY